jgi:DNA polymerase-3 subunit delta'
MFRKIRGQDHALQILTAAITNDRVAQAYLFHGPPGVGKFTSALYFGMALNCLSKSEFRPCGVCGPCRKMARFDHPDFIYLFPTPNLQMTVDGEIRSKENLELYEGYIRNKQETPWQEFRFNSGVEIRKESVSMLMRRLEISIFEANWRVCIIEDCEMMNTATANAFLKTLEEPPLRTVLLLTTSRLSMVLPTILSRCQPLYFKPLARSWVENILHDQFEYDTTTARSASRIAGGNLEAALKVASENSAILRELAFEIVKMAYHKKELEFLGISANNRDLMNAETIATLINYVSHTVSDITILATNPDDITNVDKRSDLESMVIGNPYFSEDALEFLVCCEDLKRKLKGNVNPGLVFTNLFLRTQKLFTGRD